MAAKNNTENWIIPKSGKLEILPKIMHLRLVWLDLDKNMVGNYELENILERKSKLQCTIKYKTQIEYQYYHAYVFPM